MRAKERREFEAEARRQSLLLAEAVRHPDEAAIMRELDANFDEFAREQAVDKKHGRKWK